MKAKLNCREVTALVLAAADCRLLLSVRVGVQAKTFVGIALDSPHKEYHGSSEDLIVFHQESWSDQELAELERMRVDLDLWSGHRLQQTRYRQDEFPSPDQREPFIPISKATGAAQESNLAEDRARSGTGVVKPSRAVLKARSKVHQASGRARKPRKK